MNHHPPTYLHYYLDLRKSKLLLREYVETYNDGKPLRERLRPNHVALGLELLELYRMSLWKYQSGGKLLLPGAPLPYLETNNVQLSRRMWCTERSIQHWRERLKTAGLIQEEIWHGSNAGYEIRLNPAVLYVAREGDRMRLGAGSWEQGDAAVWKSADLGVGKGPERLYERDNNHTAYGEKNAAFTEKFAPYCTRYPLDTSQLNQLEVDRCGNRAGANVDQAGNQRRFFLTGYETDSDECPAGKPPQVARRPPRMEVKGEEREMSGRLGDEKQGAGIGEQGDLVPQTVGEVVAELPEKLGRRIFREVSKVWALARTELYAEAWISDAERERALARLAEYYVYAQPQRYVAGTAEICERIRLVRKWIDRGQHLSPSRQRWVPIPSVYFDYRNDRGFRVTKAWYKQHQSKRQEIGNRIALTTAVRRYQCCLEGKNDARSPVEVYRELVAHLRERGEAVARQFVEAQSPAVGG